MNPKDDIKPITHLKNHAAELVREVSESGKAVFITQNGEGKAVLLGARTYAKWHDTMAMLKLIALGEAEKSRGEVVAHDDAIAEAFAAIDAVSRSLTAAENE